jgi:hypothetical protein
MNDHHCQIKPLYQRATQTSNGTETVGLGYTRDSFPPFYFLMSQAFYNIL